MRASGRVAWLLLALGLACGCEGERALSQVVVLVELEPEVAAETEELRITVEGFPADGTTPATQRHPIVPGRAMPFRVALTPKDGAADRSYRLEAAALATPGAREPIAIARLASHYVAGATRYVRLVIEARCLAVVCADPGLTCHEGRCLSAMAYPGTFASDESAATASVRDDDLPDEDARVGPSEAGIDPIRDGRVDAASEESDGGDAGAGARPLPCEDGGGCAQLCSATLSGRQCGCEVGFVLEADGMSCRAEPLAWTLPAALDRADTDAFGVRLAMNARGEALAAFYQDTTAGYLAVRRFRSGAFESGWVQGMGLPRPTRYGEIALAIDGTGTGYVSWSAPTASGSATASARSLAIQAPGSTVPTLDATGMLSAQATVLRLAVPSTGAPLAAYRDEASAPGLYLRPLGVAATPALLGPLGPTGDGALAVDEREGTAALWFEAGRMTAYVGDGTNLREVGAPDPQGSVLHTDDGVKLALDGSGRALALWGVGATPQETRLFYATYDPAEAAFSPPVELRPGKRILGYDLGMAASGEAVAVWYESTPPPNPRGFFASARHRGTGWTPSTALSGELGSGTGAHVRVAVNATGLAIAAWAEGKGANNTVVNVRRSSPGREWSAATTLSPSPGLHGLPEVAVAADGRALVVWRHATTATAPGDLLWSQLR